MPIVSMAKEAALLFWGSSTLPFGVAHRGGDAAGSEKENSMAAFQAAYDMGYEWFETDVVPTKDDVLLAIHGRGFQLRPNRDLPLRSLIQRMTLDEVEQAVKVGGEPPVQLEDLLSTFPDARWFVDPKVDASVQPLVKILSKRKGDIPRVNIGAFSQRRVSGVAEGIKQSTGQSVCTSIGPKGLAAFVLASRGACGLEQLRSILKTTGASSVSMPFKLSRKLEREPGLIVDFAHELGMRVVVWTVNDEERMKEAVGQTVDAIMSDRVGLLKKVLSDTSSSKSSV